MKYWDTSAIVPLLVREKDSHLRLKILKEDPSMVVWWGTRIECVSALTRLHREGGIADAGMDDALLRLDHLAEGWIEVEPVDGVRTLARRLLRVHALRAADALQLAAALSACEHDPRRMPFLSADERLSTAARLEGFEVIG